VSDRRAIPRRSTDHEIVGVATRRADAAEVSDRQVFPGTAVDGEPAGDPADVPDRRVVERAYGRSADPIPRRDPAKVVDLRIVEHARRGRADDVTLDAAEIVDARAVEHA